jgi:hypothetical protein
MKLLKPSAGLVAIMLMSFSLAAQSPAPSLLRIDVTNHTIYVYDTDQSRWATTPSKLTRGQPKVFESWLAIGDIVSINGSPVKGTVFEHSLTVTSSLNLTPGQAIADVARGGLFEWNLDVLQADGTPLGLIRISGLSGGPPPPDAPKTVPRANYTVTGGTSVFTGAHGYYFADIDPLNNVRVTSIAEDPAYRRVNGGGTLHLTLYLVPATPAQVVALYHTDFSLVTRLNPARPGQTIIARATGLGPVRPAVDPGQPFPKDQEVIVSSPVTLMVNDQPVDTLKAVGWPGTADNYGVYFPVPGGTPAGAGTVRLGVAWMWGPASEIRFGTEPR